MWLHAAFVQSMKEFIHKPRRAPWDANDARQKAHPPRGGTPKELEEWATLRWETILHYVVGLGKVHLDLKDESSPLVRDVRGVPSLIIDMLENCMLLDVTTVKTSPRRPQALSKSSLKVPNH